MPFVRSLACLLVVSSLSAGCKLAPSTPTVSEVADAGSFPATATLRQMNDYLVNNTATGFPGLPDAAKVFLEAVGVDMGVTEDIAGALSIGAWVWAHWDVIGPALVQAQAIATEATPVIVSAGSSVATVAANLLPYVPTALVAVAAAGLITVAIFQAQIQASRINDADQARQWQMAQAVNRDIYGPQRGVLRLPSMFPGVADMILSRSTGYPSADQVSEQLIQNYIVTAFQAKGTGRDSDVSRAWTQLSMIRNVASQPAETTDW